MLTIKTSRYKYSDSFWFRNGFSPESKRIKFTLFPGYGCPAEFQMFLQYCRGLKFDESPDYNYLRQLFQVLLNSMGYEMDNFYDWTNMMDQAMKKKENSSSSGYASSENQQLDPNKNKLNLTNSGIGTTSGAGGGFGGKSARHMSSGLAAHTSGYGVQANNLNGTGGLLSGIIGGNLSSNVKPNIIDASQIGIAGGNNGNNVGNQSQFDARKSQGAKSLYKESSSRGYWLRFPFSALLGLVWKKK